MKAGLVLVIVIMLVLKVVYMNTLVNYLDADSGIIGSSSYTISNHIGLSMYFNQLIPYLNSTLFKSYLNNSRIRGSTNNLFHQAIHVPLGYKFNCSPEVYPDVNITCLYELEADNDTLQNLRTYLKEFSGSLTTSLGWDSEKINFTNPQYYSNFIRFFDRYRSTTNLQLIDKGDLMFQQHNTTYSVSTYLADLTRLSSRYRGIQYIGIGLSENASAVWKQQSQDISKASLSYFESYRCVLFKNQSQATIQNLLSQTYTKTYLTNRFSIDNNLIDLNIYTSRVNINEIRLMEGMGIDGITNSYATAIWALDFCLTFKQMGGSRIDFYNTFKPSFQSVFNAPHFTPNPIHYGLFLSILTFNGLYNMIVQETTGSNTKIKVYDLDRRAVLMINKNTDPNHTGKVEISTTKKIHSITCIYMQAPSMASTTNVTLGGLYWIGNNSQQQGEYTEYFYKKNINNTFMIDLNYTQVAYCRYVFLFNNGFEPLKRKKNTNKALHLTLSGLYVLMLMMILN